MIFFSTLDDLAAFLEGQEPRQPAACPADVDTPPAPDPVLVYLSAVEAASHRLASDLETGMSKIRAALASYTAAVRHQDAEDIRRHDANAPATAETHNHRSDSCQ